MQHELNKPHTNTIMFYPFLYFKNLHALKKIKSVSKEDTSHFFDKKILALHLMKTQTSFD